MPAPPALTRRPARDRCPGVLALWPAADGGLARIRVPGGRLEVKAWAALAAAAAELGSGVLELTARANVQLRGLRPGAETDLADRLRPVGLLPSAAHDRVRNIVASPAAGLDLLHGPTGRPDIGPLVQALDAGLCADPELAGLPGKVLFTVDDGTGDVTALGGDVGLVAAGEGYLVCLGGADVSLRVPAEHAVAAALGAARGFLAERAEAGSGAWRLAELADGPARVAARVRSAVPTQAPGETPLRPALRNGQPLPLGAATQGDGRVALVVGAPDGRLTAAAAGELARAADRVAGLRITPWRSVILPDLVSTAAPRVAARLLARGLLIDDEGHADDHRA